MGKQAADELMRMLDGVDGDVEEFGMADEASQILVQVKITLRNYYHSFQQGWVWQRAVQARVPAELCVTVALDNSDGETESILRLSRDHACMVGQQDVVEL